MGLEQQIQDGIKAAMIAKDKVKLEALRAVKSEILLAKTAAGGAAKELADSDVVKLIQKLVKQHNESAELYKQNNRQDLADNELAEAKHMEGFLPKQLSAEELEAELKKIIAAVGATKISDLGKVMGTATKQLAGKAEGSAIVQAVKKLLSQL
jgi:uncharacterized protein YqeY